MHPKALLATILTGLAILHSVSTAHADRFLRVDETWEEMRAHHVLPSFEALAQTSSDLTLYAKSFCLIPDSGHLEAVRFAYVETVLALERVLHIGPVESGGPSLELEAHLRSIDVQLAAVAPVSGIDEDACVPLVDTAEALEGLTSDLFLATLELRDVDRQVALGTLLEAAKSDLAQLSSLMEAGFDPVALQTANTLVDPVSSLQARLYGLRDLLLGNDRWGGLAGALATDQADAAAKLDVAFGAAIERAAELARLHFGVTEGGDLDMLAAALGEELIRAYEILANL